MKDPQQLDLFLPRDITPDPKREEVIKALDMKEKWRIDEAAYYLRCTTRHIYNLIFDGTLIATNIARLPDSQACYRLYRDQVKKFERSRIEGAHEPTE